MLDLFLDLDGTLTNPFEGITRSMQHALVALGRDAVEAEDLRVCIGPPLRETFRRLLECDDPAVIEAAVAAYRERYFELGLFENSPYDGVTDMLALLRDRGHRLRLVTSKVVPAAERIVEHFGLAGYLDGVHGSELDGRFDDKGELIAHVLASNAIEPGGCVMIGDRMHDVSAARRNRVRAIGVTWGFGTPAELIEAGADALCDHPSAVPAAVAGFSIRANNR